jgi:hypothetical protein
MSKVISFIETPTIIIAYSHPQQAHSQDVIKDVRYQSVSQSIDQSTQSIIQSVDQPTSVIQTSLRQASLQSLYSHLSYNSLYAAMNQPYHPQLYHSYNQSLYGSTNQYASINSYALFESPRSSYVSNQIRFTSQASQSNLPQSSQSSQPSSFSFASASASQSASEPVQFNQSYTSND